MTTMPDPILPVADDDSAPYWAATGQHRLVAQQCSDCSTFRFPPSPVCHRCRSWDFRWEDLPAHGTLYSWVVARHAVVDAFRDVPYVVGLVEYAPSVRIPGRLRGLDPDACRAGMALRVTFRDVAPDLAIPEFVPVSNETER